MVQTWGRSRRTKVASNARDKHFPGVGRGLPGA